MQGIPGPKSDPPSEGGGSDFGDGRLGQISFLFERKPQGPAGFQGLGGADKDPGEINAHNLRNLPGQLKGRPSHRAPQVQSPAGLVFPGLHFRKKQGGAGGGEIADSKRRTVSPGKKAAWLEVVKRQILREGGGGFVGGFQARSCSR